MKDCESVTPFACYCLVFLLCLLITIKGNPDHMVIQVARDRFSTGTLRKLSKKWFWLQFGENGWSSAVTQIWRQKFKWQFPPLCCHLLMNFLRKTTWSTTRFKGIFRTIIDFKGGGGWQKGNGQAELMTTITKWRQKLEGKLMIWRKPC